MDALALHRELEEGGEPLSLMNALPRKEQVCECLCPSVGVFGLKEGRVRVSLRRLCGLRSAFAPHSGARAFCVLALASSERLGCAALSGARAFCLLILAPLCVLTCG